MRERRTGPLCDVYGRRFPYFVASTAAATDAVCVYIYGISTAQQHSQRGRLSTLCSLFSNDMGSVDTKYGGTECAM